MEVPLDFTPLLQKLGRTVSGSDLRIRLLEVDAAGRVIREVIPVQFDRTAEDDPKTNLRGTLTFMLTGPMIAHTERLFQVELDFEPREAGSSVVLVDQVEHEGQKSFRIVTPQATGK